jgi:hypothetical protein
MRAGGGSRSFLSGSDQAIEGRVKKLVIILCKKLAYHFRVDLKTAGWG